MDVIQQPEKEFLCIVLSRALVLFCSPTHHLFESGTHDWVVLSAPQTLEQESKLLRDVAGRRQLGAVLVEVSLVGVRDEVLGESVRVAQALEDGVHEAGVAVVVEPAQLLLLGREYEARRSLQLRVVARTRSSSLEAVSSPRTVSPSLIRPPAGCDAGASRDRSRQPVPLVSLAVSRGGYVLLFLLFPVLLLAEPADKDAHERAQMLHLFLLGFADVSFHVLVLLRATVVLHAHGATSPAVGGVLLRALFPLGVQERRVRHVAVVMISLQTVDLPGLLSLLLERKALLPEDRSVAYTAGAGPRVRRDGVWVLAVRHCSAADTNGRRTCAAAVGYVAGRSAYI